MTGATPGGAEGYSFSPDSQMWRVNREAALLLGGPAAAILQVAHPEIAAGVVAHSSFKSDPLGRLHRTLDAIYTITFSTVSEARAMSAEIEKRHRRVRGTEPVPYSAQSQDASLWVLATLVMVGLWIYESLVAELTKAEKEGYLADMREFGRYFGLAPEFGPQNFDDFAAYTDAMLDGDQLCSHPICAEVAEAVLRPGRPIFLSALSRLLAPVVIETLPEQVRERLGFRSSAPGRVGFEIAKRVLRMAIPLMPAIIRFVGPYRKAIS